MTRPGARFRTLLWLLGGLAIAISQSVPATAHHANGVCGTTPEIAQQTLFLHRQAQQARASRLHALDTVPLSTNQDIGNIAVIGDGNGVVATQNQFNLDNNSLLFTPAAPNAASYRYSGLLGGYDSAAANATPLVALDDDDARPVSLPFAFPFFGVTYNQVFVNSDGNLTFAAAEYASTARSLGRMTAGPPRIAPLFDDLDPSKTAGGVRVYSDPTRVVVSWVAVPEYSDYGSGYPETFQVWLFPDGRIQFSYHGINSALASAIVGVAPGNLQGATSIVDFRGDPSGVYSGAVAEVFGSTLAVDIVTAAQQFYATHEDSYDYLVIYNNMNIQAMGDALAYENPVRSSGTGYNLPAFDSGQQYGSPSRLRSILNMGQLSEYPVDPTALVPGRAAAGDTPITILAHETGHLFLAYASVPDPANPGMLPMLGYQLAHWNFAYDSEASVLEGERIVDKGAGVSPRFLTTDTVQGYSPLDQYLMGFRPSAQVPDTFYVSNVTENGFSLDTSQLHPQRNVAFDGTRHDVTIDALVQAVGRRTPDYTVAQRRYRFAFILVVPQGTQPSSADLAQVDTYRQQFETFYASASGGNAIADTSLKRSMKLSLFPAAGAVAGAGPASGTITLQNAPSANLTIQLQPTGGHANFPASVTILAGATTASFSYTGLKSGVDQLLAVPADPSYETVAANIQVGDASVLKLAVVSGDQQVSNSSDPLPNPIVVSLSDVNSLVYAGARIDAAPSAGGTVSANSAITDAQGHASFRWTPGAGSSNQLQFTVDGAPSVSLTVRAGKAIPVIAGVTNAASFVPGLAPGGLATVFGQNFGTGSSTQVLLNGTSAPLLYSSDTQINFYVPSGLATGTATLTVATPGGITDPVAVTVAAVQPGIFPGAILKAGTAVRAASTPVHAGDYIEIYCTGLGATQASGANQVTISSPTVFLGAIPVQPVYSGLAPGFQGLYQVDVQIPVGLAAGAQPVILEVDLQHSNIVNILVQ